MDTRGTVSSFYKEDYLTLLHTKYKSSRTSGFEKKTFVYFPIVSNMLANDPQGGAIFDPRGMIGRIYVEHFITLLHT